MEHVSEISLGVYSVATTALDEGVNDGAAPTGVGMSDKEPTAFSDR